MNKLLLIALLGTNLMLVSAMTPTMFLQATDCELGCVVCDDGDTTICTQCDYGFYLSEADCYSCAAKCQVCSSETSCSKCSSGYYIEGDQCLDLSLIHI